MNETTVANVKAIASNLSEMPDETIQLYIEDAKLEMQNLKYAPVYEEKLMRYMAAHLGTLDMPKVTTEKLDGVGSQSYQMQTSEDGLKGTPYGREVLRILKKSSGGIFVIS